MRSRRILLLLPGLLGASARHPDHAVEAAKAIGAMELRALCTLLSRANRQGSVGTDESPERLLFETLGVAREGDDWPSAAICAIADGAAWRPEAWIRADPVHLDAGPSDLSLGDPRELDMTCEESVELCSAINRTLNGVPGRVEPLAPARWYIGLDATPRLSTHELSLAVGGAVGEMLPRGGDAMAWLRTMTEVQMLLHDLPANRARAKEGRPVINSVWFWGAGPLPPLSDSAPGVRLWSDSVLAQGLGRGLGAACRPLPSGARALLQEEEESALDVVYCDALHYAVRLDDWSAWIEGLKEWEAQWFGPLRRALWSGEFASLRIVSEGGRWHEVPASARWQWWRRAGALATHVAKSGASPRAEPNMMRPQGRAGPESMRDPRPVRKRGGQSGNP